MLFDQHDVTIGASSVSRIAVMFLLVVGGTGLGGCAATPVSGVASASAQGIVETRAEADATRRVCIDLEARGGALYQVLVVPMLSGRSGNKSIDVNALQLRLAVDAVAEMNLASFGGAAPDVRGAAERLAASAGSFGVYEHAESTALLTAFTALAVDCTKAGHKPSWFDPIALAS